MTMRIIHSDSASREIRKLENRVRVRIMGAIDRLVESPRSGVSTKLSGHRNLYRLRVGDYRIVYLIDDAAKTVEIARVAHRREVYRDL